MDYLDDLIFCSDCGEHLRIGDWPFPCNGRGHKPGPYFTGDAEIHASEKVVIYENARTGDQRIPGRGDRPIHPKLAAEGYERKVLSNEEKKSMEKRKGLVHEPGNFRESGSAINKDYGSR
jgi:hypothetical protein